MTSLYLKHQKNPLNVGRPLFFSSKAFYRDRQTGNFIAVYLDISDKDKITSLTYEYQGFLEEVPFLSVLSEVVQGLSLEEALQLSGEDLASSFDDDPQFEQRREKGEYSFISLSLLLLTQAIQLYQGVGPSYARGLGVDPSGLICRCFGIYHSQIESFVRSEKPESVFEVTSALKAGGGCTRCMEDIEEIILEGTPLPIVLLLGKKTPAEIIITTSQLIDEWLKENNRPWNYRLKSLNYDLLTIEWSNVEEGTLGKFEESLSFSLKRSLGFTLRLQHLFS